MRKENIIEKSRAVNAAGVGMSACSTAVGWKVSDFSQGEQSGCWYLQNKIVRLTDAQFTEKMQNAIKQ